MWRLLPIALLLLFWSSQTRADEGPAGRVISGVVVDTASGAPVFAATVGNMQHETKSDKEGRFSLTLPDGVDTIVIYRDGYETAILSLKGEHQTITVSLTPLGDGTGEVIEIIGKIQEQPQPAHYELGPDVIRRVPGSGNDALKSLQTMPGVSRVPYGMGGIVLRGTSPRDSNVFLDGIEVPLLYHFGGLASFYPSSTLQSLELLGGGYSAEYGRGQGGVVLIESRPGRSDHWRMSSELSMVDLSVQADGPTGDKGAWSFGLRRSIIDAVLPFFSTDTEVTSAPRYYDGQIRYDLKLSANTKLRAQLLGSDDKIGLIYGKRNDKTFSYGTRFARFGVQLEHARGADDFALAPWIGVDKFKLESTSQRMTSSNQPYGGRTRYTRRFASGQMSVGAELSAGDYEVRSDTETDSGTMTIENTDTYQNSALWVEAEFQFFDRHFNIKPGLRAEHYSLSNETVVDPRLVVTHELQSKVVLRESLGLFHQPPSVADALWGNEDLESSYSIQATAGGEFPLSNTIQLAATGFYTDLRNLPVDDPTAPMESLEHLYASKIGALSSSREFMAKQFGTFSQLRNTGAGRNYGIELMTRYVGAAGFAWLSYTGSRALRRDTEAADNSFRSYVLDQPHVLTLVASRKLSAAWQIGARARYASGNPFTPIEGAQITDDGFLPIYGEEYSERLPDFFQLDLRVDRVWKRSWGTVSAFLDVQNVTFRKNVEGRLYEDDYSSYDATHGLPFFPAFGLVYSPPAGGSMPGGP